MSRAVSEEDFLNRDVVSLDHYTNDEILFILDRAEEMIPYARGEKVSKCLDGKIMLTLFYEPSTRTRLSHETAMLRLGGRIMGVSDVMTSSVKKGETLSDTIRMADAYSDVIVLRHPWEGAAMLAAEVSKAPVINGGDGAGQHPTQTLLDLFTIRRELNGLENINVALLGDLKYGRTVHSLATALARFGCHLHFVAPPMLQMPDHVVEIVESSGSTAEMHDTPDEIIGDIDVLYVTRIQKERFPDPAEYERVAGLYRVDSRLLSEAQGHMIVMHPLPRVDEISPEVDHTSHARYFQQAFNGVPTRMALLSLIMGVTP